jgi:hypothetical protein
MKTNHRRKNPVARVLNQINRPQTHRERVRYQRTEKFRTSTTTKVFFMGELDS